MQRWPKTFALELDATMLRACPAAGGLKGRAEVIAAELERLGTTLRVGSMPQPHTLGLYRRRLRYLGKGQPGSQVTAHVGALVDELTALDASEDVLVAVIIADGSEHHLFLGTRPLRVLGCVVH